MQTAVQNLFSDQSELGNALKVSLQAVAVTIEAIGAAFTLMMTPVRAIAAFIGEVAAALTGLVRGQVIQALTISGSRTCRWSRTWRRPCRPLDR